MFNAQCWRMAAVAGASLVLAACADLPTSRSPSPTLDLAMNGAAAGGPTRELSLAIAGALADPAVRTGIRDAMRASLLANHKLILQEYLATSAGNRLYTAMASSRGMNPGKLEELLASFPALDIYLPFRQHRLTWRGGTEILVGATMDRSHTPVLLAFSSEGRPVALVRKDGTPGQPLLLLHPSTSRNIRFQPQPDTPGQTVQDPGDGEESGRVTYIEGDGSRREVQVADILSRRTSGPRINYLIDCGSECSGGGGGSGPAVSTADTTYIRAFEIYWTWDSEWGGHEVYFIGSWNRNGRLYKQAQYQRDGVEACDFGTSQGSCIAWQSRVPGVPLFVGERLRGVFVDEYIHFRVFEDNWISPDFHGTTEYRAHQIGLPNSTNGGWHPMCVPFCTIETIFDTHAVMKLEATRHVN